MLRALTLLLENAALAPEPCLSSLLAVEAALCRQFSATSFAQLGVGCSLLNCLDDGGCPRLATTAQLLLHSHTTPPASLLLFAAACAAGLEADDDAARLVVAASPAFATAAAAAALEHCGCPPVGLQLVLSRLTTALLATARSQPLPLAALMFPDRLRRIEEEEAAGLGVLGVEAALFALRQAPLLSDLSTACQWEHVFASTLGDLGNFLKTRGREVEYLQVALLLLHYYYYYY